MNSGVGSSVVPLSPGAPTFASDGSVPLSLSSVAVIGAPVESVSGLPLASTASPPTVTWLSRTPVAATASTSTLNSKTNESPIANSDGVVVSTISVALPPFQLAASKVTLLAGSVGPLTIARPLAFT